MKRVLITGAAGLIGGILTSRLADRYDLVTHVHRESSTANFVGDISSFDFVSSMVASSNPDAIIHLAAAATLESEWDVVLGANIVGAYNIFESARQAGVDRVVFASTNHVIGGYELNGGGELYRLNDERVYSESTVPWPDSLYGASKVFGEALGRLYADRHHLRVICLRIGSVLPDDDPARAVASGAGGWLHLSPEDLLHRYQATWLSHRDCTELFACALEANVDWAVAYGTSNNRRKIWDITSASKLLGYRPADGA